MNLGDLTVTLKALTEALEKGLETSAKKLEETGKKMEMMGLKAAVVEAALVELGKSFVEAADAAEGVANRFGVAFGDMAGSVDSQLGAMAGSMGRSRDEMRDFASGFGLMLSGMGESREAAAQMSTSLSGLAVDMASFFHTSDSDAAGALQMGLMGNGRALRQFGIEMNSASLQQYAFSKGMLLNVSEMSEAQKATLTASFMMDRLRFAMGDAAAHSDSFDNRMKTLHADLHVLAVELGEKLMPVADKIVKWLDDVVRGFANLSPGVQSFILQAGVVAAGIAAIGAAMVPLGIAIEGLGAVAGVLGMLAGVAVPLLIAAVAAGALVAAFGALKQAWDSKVTQGFKDGLKDALTAMSNDFNAFIEYLETELELFGAAVSALWTAVKSHSAAGLGAVWTSLNQQQATANSTLGAKLSGEIPPDTTGQQKLADAGDALKDAASTMKDALSGMLSTLKDSFSNGLAGILDMLPPDARAALKKALDEITKALEGAKKKIDDAVALPKGTSGSDNPDQARVHDAAGFALSGLTHSGTGLAGSVVQGGMQGFQAGGPLGAAAGAALALLQASKGFKDLMAEVNVILQQVADNLGGILEAVVPLLKAVEQVLKPLYGALAALAPLVISLNPVFQLLLAVLKPLAQAVTFVVRAIESAALGVLNAINHLLHKVGIHSHALDDAINSLQNALDGINALGGAAAGAAQVMNDPQGFKLATYEFAAMSAAGHGGHGGLGGNGPLTGGSGTTVHGSVGVLGNVTIVSNDPVEIWKKIQDLMKRQSYRTHGTTQSILTPFPTR